MRRVFARGFTLVEMLVVITIVVILAALLYPAVISMRNKAKKTECEALLMKVDAALRKYKTDTGTYPTAHATWKTHNKLRADLVDKGYLDTADMPSWSLNPATNDGMIYDNYVADGEKVGKPLIYVYFDTASWPQTEVVWEAGFKQEFQLWSLGADGKFGDDSDNNGSPDSDSKLGVESQTFNKDNVTVTAYK